MKSPVQQSDLTSGLALDDFFLTQFLRLRPFLLFTAVLFKQLTTSSARPVILRKAIIGGKKLYVLP